MNVSESVRAGALLTVSLYLPSKSVTAPLWLELFILTVTPISGSPELPVTVPVTVRVWAWSADGTSNTAAAAHVLTMLRKSNI